jgi:hypothetical protein
MKRILAAIFIFLLFCGAALAADVVQTGNGYDQISENMRTATFTITADGAGNVAIFSFLNPRMIYGWNLLSVEMQSATDDAFVVLITTNLGSSLFSYTTTAATTGHLENATDRWPIYSTPKIDVTGLTATEVATVIVTFQR